MKALRYIVLAAGIAMTSVPAGAMPLTPQDSTTRMDITQVAAGCGPGMIWGPHGKCRPQFTCPHGYHPGAQGQHCYRNKR